MKLIRCLLFSALFIACPFVQARRLKPLVWPEGKYTATKDGVAISTRILSKEETQNLFKGNGEKLVTRKNPVFPIECVITNETDKVMLLHPENINLPLLPAQEVAKRFEQHGIFTSAIVATTLACSAICLGYFTFVVGAVALAYSAPAYTLLCLPGAIGTGLCVKGATESCYFIATNSASNKAIHKKVDYSTIINELIIAPGESEKFLLFADGNAFKKQFLVSLVNANDFQDTTTIALHLE